MKLVTHTSPGARLGDFLLAGLNGSAEAFRGATAFARRSGVVHVAQAIESFSRDRPLQLVVGVDLQGTSIEALELILESLGQHGKAFVFHDPATSKPTFHPKLYQFIYPDRDEVYAGSGNLTRGGLFTNHEAGVLLSLDRSDDRQAALSAQFDAAFDDWTDPEAPNVVQLTSEAIRALSESGLIFPEAALTAVARAQVSFAPRDGLKSDLFRPVGLPKAPAVPLVEEDPVASSAELSPPTREPDESDTPSPPSPRFFAMTLQRTDVGVGQVTPGAARRSPEIFVPLGARDQHPDFWGWQHAFTEDRLRPGKFDRTAVRMHIGGAVVPVNMMTWPVKHDFRLRSEHLRSAGNPGDIILLERSEASGIDYIVEIVPVASTRYPALLARCDQRVRSSARRFGYF